MSTYWASNNGQITCDQLGHAGMYLRSAIEAFSKARRHDTPITTWVKLTKSEIEEVKTWNPEVCESCHYGR